MDSKEKQLLADSERFIHLQVLEFITWESVDGHAISKFRHFINGLEE